nr:hypothetical protein [Phocaeicola abscessus]
MRRKLTLTQIILIALVWAICCFIVLISVPKIDGPLLLTVLISAAMVFVPLYQYLKDKRG